jgi:hypothetical protein
MEGARHMRWEELGLTCRDGITQSSRGDRKQCSDYVSLVTKSARGGENGTRSGQLSGAKESRQRQRTQLATADQLPPRPRRQVPNDHLSSSPHGAEPDPSKGNARYTRQNVGRGPAWIPFYCTRKTAQRTGARVGKACLCSSLALQVRRNADEPHCWTMRLECLRWTNEKFSPSSSAHSRNSGT